MKKDLSKIKMTYEIFKEFAKDEMLSKYEKIGFPDNYRKGFEVDIFKNISEVLKLEREGINICDIGCGCSDLPNLIISNAIKRNQKLFLIDSKEMLDQIDYRFINDNIIRLPGRFPNEINISEFEERIDAIIIYSVLQHIILEYNPFYVLDKAVKMLKEGGRLLIGDIPNISKRNRFFASEEGLKYHQNFTKTKTKPEYKFNVLYEDKIDDSLIFSILMRYRYAGYETYLLEQPNNLPLSNRREDILIVKH